VIRYGTMKKTPSPRHKTDRQRRGRGSKGGPGGNRVDQAIAVDQLGRDVPGQQHDQHRPAGSREKLVTDFSATQVKRDQKRSRHRDAVDQGEEHPPLP
jgi:hypothetical protein